MFNSKNLRDIQNDIMDAMSEVESKHGITITPHAGTQGHLDAILKFKLSATNQDGESQAAVDFKRHAKLHGMKPEWLGAELQDGRKTYTITGFLPDRRKYVVEITNPKGKRYVISAEAVVNAMRLIENIGKSAAKLRSDHRSVWRLGYRVYPQVHFSTRRRDTSPMSISRAKIGAEKEDN